MCEASQTHTLTQGHVPQPPQPQAWNLMPRRPHGRCRPLTRLVDVHRATQDHVIRRLRGLVGGCRRLRSTVAIIFLTLLIHSDLARPLVTPKGYRSIRQRFNVICVQNASPEPTTCDPISELTRTKGRSFARFVGKHLQGSMTASGMKVSIREKRNLSAGETSHAVANGVAVVDLPVPMH